MSAPPPFNEDAVLDFNIFEGDYGDGERTLKDVIGRPRKAFTCQCCAETEQPGGWARLLTESGPDGIVTHRWCEECCIAMGLYDYDEGNAISARFASGDAIRGNLGEREMAHREGVAIATMQASLLERDAQIAEQSAP